MGVCVRVRVGGYTTQDQLIALYESQPDLVQPPARRNEVLNRIKAGLTGAAPRSPPYIYICRYPDTPLAVRRFPFRVCRHVKRNAGPKPWFVKGGYTTPNHVHWGLILI